jgi:fatty-acid desaturase
MKKSNNKSIRNYIKLSLMLFFFAGIFHLLRSIYQAPLNVGSVQISLMVSYLLAIITIVMIYHGFKLLKSYSPR